MKNTYIYDIFSLENVYSKFSEDEIDNIFNKHIIESISKYENNNKDHLLNLSEEKDICLAKIKSLCIEDFNESFSDNNPFFLKLIDTDASSFDFEKAKDYLSKLFDYFEDIESESNEESLEDDDENIEVFSSKDYTFNDPNMSHQSKVLFQKSKYLYYAFVLINLIILYIVI